MLIDWYEVRALPWRERNATVERTVRVFLAGVSRIHVYSTQELACNLDPLADSSLAQLLSRMAKHMAPLATHDGETIVRYGRRWQRYRWHGQK